MVKRSILALLVGMLVLGAASLATAGEGGAKPEGAKPEAAKAEKAGKRMTRIEQALAQVQLTDEQKGKVDPIVAEYKEKTKATKEIADRKKLHDETVQKILPLLTDEQKPKFEAALKAKGPGVKKEKKEGEAK